MKETGEQTPRRGGVGAVGSGCKRPCLASIKEEEEEGEGKRSDAPPPKT